jgi:hypothetical protein
MTIAATLAQLGNFLKNGGTLDSATYLNAQAFTVGDDSLLINGRMEFSQDLGTTLTTLTSASIKYVADQWMGLYVHAANTAVIKSQQVSLIGSAALGNMFPNGMQITATTALTSPASGDCVQLYQPIEASRLAKLGYGNALGSPSTFTFWVNATVSGTATFQLKNAVPNRTFLYNFAVVAGTWTFVSIPIPPDVTGTWTTTLGSLGAYIGFCFVGGSTLQGTNNAWQAGNFSATSSTTNFFATANNVVAITGANWHPGNTGPSAARSPLIIRPPEDEQRYCQRFFWASTLGMAVGGAQSTTSGIFGATCPAVMRVTATSITLTGTVSVDNLYNTATSGSTLSGWYATPERIGVFVSGFGSTMTPPQPQRIIDTSTGVFRISSRF